VIVECSAAHPGVGTGIGEQVIRTASKEKLPKGKSYPVGAEIISELLEGVPQYSDLTLTFWIQDQYFASQYNKKLQDLGSIVVLEASFSPTFDEWKIRINSVPSEFKNLVGHELISVALPELKLRLHKYKTESGLFQFQVRFSLRTQKVTFV
jgi:hypothetical protein